MTIGLFYGSSTCYTEMAAEKIRDYLGDDIVTLHNLNSTPVARMQKYPILIMGIPTWDFGELQEDWEAAWSSLAELDLKGKIVALYGLGDQEEYGEWFLDALGMLHDLLAVKGVEFVGDWPASGYQFTSTKALNKDGDKFVGLALDDITQFEQTDRRIADWCDQILTEMALLTQRE